jgi:chromosome segregation ATPase
MSAAIIERKFHIAAAKSRRSQQQSVRLRPGLLIFIIGWIQMLPVLSARPTFRLPTIFGGVLNDSNNNDENNNTRHLDGPLPFRQQQQQSPFPANAGPPPPPRQPDANNTLQQPQYPYLTPPQYPQRPFTTDQQQQQQQQPFVPTYPSMHAPTLNNNMNHQQQQYQQQLYSDSRYPTLQHQLHVAVCRERELAAHAHNLSRAYAHLQTSYDACACDLTLATKRALHAETVAATRANQLLEALDNGTRLAALITTLNETCAEYRHECLALQESYQNQSLLAKQWQTKYQRASHNATDLAALIERHGLERAGNNVKNTNKRIVKKKKRRSVLAWLFGWNKDDNDDDQDELAGVYAQARSTLLQALQTERANVDELESALASLQQNNSAVAQQVQSRDLIINELNDRVAVFEEDKVVLKAALRQLRKEMSEEAPKTQALVNELKAAKKEIGKLQATLQKLTKAHKDELASINMALKAKDLTIQQAEANLTEIGMYVDRLEGRLADFAVARRDITAREKKCGDIEAAFNTSKQERGRLQQKVAELESEHADLKQLLQQMAEERTKLLSQTTSRNALQQEAAQLRQTLVNFETDYKSLENANADLLVRLDHLTKESSNLVESKQDLENRLSSTDSEFNALQHTIDSSLKEKQQLSLRLQYIESERLELQQTIQQLQLLLQNGERQQESKAESDAELQEKIASLEASNNRLQDFVHQLEARRQDLELSNEQLEALLEKRVHMDSSEASQLASSLPLLPSRVRIALLPKRWL